MNIQEATKIAVKNNLFIARESEMFMKILPSKDTCIVMMSEEVVNSNPIPRGGWQPNQEDLMADDWVAVEGGFRGHKTYKWRKSTFDLPEL